MDTLVEQPALETLSYEEAITRLEAVLAQLEAADLPLEQALALYEQGATLAALCAQKLEAAELRVRQWQVGNETTLFDGWQEK